jgi:hypothetical protein
MLIKREVIARMRETYPDLYYEPEDPRNRRISILLARAAAPSLPPPGGGG